MRTGVATFTLDHKQNQPQPSLVDKISSTPQIPLQNYLMRLVAENDANESSVYLVGIANIIQDVWNEIVKNRPRKIYVRSLIPKVLGVHHMMLYDYKNGKKAISIQTLYKLLLLWQTVCHKSDIELSRKWQNVFESNFYFTSKRRSLITLPKVIDPKLAYLTGWICGDGNLVSYDNHYLLKISEKSTDQLEHILKPLVKDIFNLNAAIYHIYQGGYALQVNSKPLFRFLRRVLDIYNGAVPKFVYVFDNINLAYFLAGIFDSEGNVYKNRYKVAIAQAKKNFLLEIKSLSLRLGIQWNGPIKHITKLGTWYTIRLEKKSEIKKFADLVGSYHVDKSLKLASMIARMKRGEKNA